MPYVLVRHRIADPAQWRSVFDEDADNRQGHGLREERLFRNADDPNELLLLLQVEDLDRARDYAESEELQERAQRAGVLDEPDVWLLEEARSPSS